MYSIPFFSGTERIRGRAIHFLYCHMDVVSSLSEGNLSWNLPGRDRRRCHTQSSVHKQRPPARCQVRRTVIFLLRQYVKSSSKPQDLRFITTQVNIRCRYIILANMTLLWIQVSLLGIKHFASEHSSRLIQKQPYFYQLGK